MKMTNSELMKIKCAICKALGWYLWEFDLIPSGKKGGRPNWEVEHHASKIRYAFTAFDAGDIDGLHEVQR